MAKIKNGQLLVAWYIKNGEPVYRPIDVEDELDDGIAIEALVEIIDQLQQRVKDLEGSQSKPL